MNKFVMFGLLCTTSPSGLLAEENSQVILSFYQGGWRDDAVAAITAEAVAEKIEKSEPEKSSLILPKQGLIW